MQIDRACVQQVLLVAGIGPALGLMPFLYENLGKCFVIDQTINQNGKILVLKTCPDKRLNFGFLPISIPVDAIAVLTVVSVVAGLFALKRHLWPALEVPPLNARRVAVAN